MTSLPNPVTLGADDQTVVTILNDDSELHYIA